MKRARSAAILFCLLLLTGVALWWLTRSPEPEVDAAEGESAVAAENAPEWSMGSDPAQLPDTQLASVSGKVLDEEGQPIEGAKACVSHGNYRQKSWLRAGPQCANTKGDGSYRIEGVVPGVYYLHGQAPGHIAANYVVREHMGRRHRQLRVPASAELLDLDITLEGGAVKVVGYVEDLSGGVIEDAFVFSTNSWGGPNDGNANAVTDVEGRFELWLRPGEVSITASATGYNRRYASIAAPGSTPHIRLTPESVIEGIVVDASTQAPLPGLLISAAGTVRGNTRPTRSDAEGRFRLDQLLPGRYEVNATGPEHFGMTAGVQLNFAGTTEVRVEAHPATTIEGTVMVAGSDRGCEDASVTIADKSISRYHMLETDERGWGRVEGVLPGNYQLRVRCQGYVSPEEIPDIVVVAGEAVPEQSWVVEEGKRLHGVVVDANDQPVRGLFVHATFETESGGRSRNRRTRVDNADGSWELFGLRPGKAEVSAGGSPFSNKGGKVEVEVPVDGEAESVRLVADATGIVQGSVRDANGNPVAKANVRARSSKGSSSSTHTNDGGEFKVEGVTVGEVRVTPIRGGKVLRAPGTHDDDEQGEVLQVEAGEVATVDLVVASTDGFITGRVLDAEGAPVVDAFVNATRMNDSRASAESSNRRVARSRWGEWRNEPTLTGAEGRFRIEDLSEGRYVLRAYHKEGGDALVEDVELGSDVELTIPRVARVAGQVSAPGGAPPESFEVSLIDEAAGRRIRSRFYRTKGAFAFEGVDAGTYELLVASSEGDAKVEGVVVEEGSSVEDLLIELERKITLRGRVVDEETGEPIAGIRGSAGLERWPSWGGLSASDDPDVSGKDGVFVIDDTQGKALYLRLVPLNYAKSDYGWTTVPLKIPAGAKEHDLGDVTMMKSRLESGESAGSLGFKTKQPEAGEDLDAAPLEVAVVTPGGPADQGGMKIGDVIVSVDGNSVSDGSKHHYGTLSRVAEGTKLVFGMADGRSVTVVAGPATGR